jgi:hypothetical protein
MSFELTAESFALAVEDVLEQADQSGNAVVDNYEAVVTNLMNQLGDRLGLGVQAQAEEDVSVVMRRQIKQQARIDARKKHPEWTRRDARDAVNRELTDERIIEAIQKAADVKLGPGNRAGISDWWLWLKQNWSWSTFFSILGFLLIFI